MGKKILTIDDEDFIRDLVHDFLELEGIECDKAANVEDA
jgi:DNA-binding response OmpR family regulator